MQIFDFIFEISIKNGSKITYSFLNIKKMFQNADQCNYSECYVQFVYLF